MREEATLEQWGRLYEIATRIKEREPWERFWDMDLIGIRDGEEEDTVFFSVLGRGGDCYGITVYEGYEGLNSFLMLAMQQHLNLPQFYVMQRQKNLSCYWGDREELSKKQWRTVKDLGYSYRGKNQWLYFMSYEPGYFPYNLDADEVERMTGHLSDLDLALEMYDKTDTVVDFSEGNMFLLSFSGDRKTWSACEAPLPFCTFQYGQVVLEDEILCRKLSKAQRCDAILEADVSSMMTSVSDQAYDRPANPALALLGDADSGMVLKFEMTQPQEEPLEKLVSLLCDFILQCGVPKEINVANEVVAAGVSCLCELCGIDLYVVDCLPGLDGFQEMFRGRFM